MILSLSLHSCTHGRTSVIITQLNFVYDTWLDYHVDMTEQLRYLTFDELLARIPGPNGEACRRLYSTNKALFDAAPGSSQNHQAWPGGYKDHVTELLNIGLQVWHLYDSLRPLPFPSSDVLLITYLHDLEKPFRYSYDAEGSIITNPELPDKITSEAFKIEKIQASGITLTPLQQNALEYVEGIRDHKYRRNARVMSELAVICHIADLTSARLWYNYPASTDDTWSGAQRSNPHTTDIKLASEWDLDV